MISEHRRLIAQLVADGDLTPDWAEVFERVPRHMFIPDRFWDRGEHDWFQRDRNVDPGVWLQRVYSNGPIVVQIDDGRENPDVTRPRCTSAAIMPTVVAMMLDQLDVASDAQVLELGTGTGYTTALLAERVGAENVVTVELDSRLAYRAGTTLRRAGWDVAVAIRDGNLGWARRAPYDRVLSSYAVRRIPYTWLRQCVDGGVIVAPWGTPYANAFLLRFTVHDEVADGRFLAAAAFPWDRCRPPRFRAMDDLAEQRPQAVVSRTLLRPYQATPGSGSCLAVGIRVPRCQWVWEDGEEPGSGTVWLYDDAESWASVTVPDQSAEEFAVHEYGPRRLWREVEEAHAWWQRLGSPEQERFGMTVTPEEQVVWLDCPDTPVHRWGPSDR
ncbi:protein-L-isoaspartate(D-aspartate) O-methyltransferase [Thermobifida halotolerans]|uniref:Protein-L-isoaspartate O-methyltransferase n=1 Tax=Thermobifida halotolerans TaxID=483545 RepID=A0A399FY58_9ACTN|nr:rRNA adenine N-6-methyltransferase family protein [Thermobifida halotolerans]UOE19155.1 protein-L-isoaspartate(D-aspartate) O-methyltransferase [Thermobifida halotolerans]